MPDGLHDTDILVWAETQATLLRRLAAGERVNADIDWLNVIDEVHDVGVSELRSCESLLLQAMLPLLKLGAWPGSRSAEYWDDEADALFNGARRRVSPSMRQKLDIADLYAEALRRTRKKHDDSGPAGVLPEPCPFTIDALLEADVANLVSRLRGPEEGQDAGRAV